MINKGLKNYSKIVAVAIVIFVIVSWGFKIVGKHTVGSNPYPVG